MVQRFLIVAGSLRKKALVASRSRFPAFSDGVRRSRHGECSLAGQLMLRAAGSGKPDGSQAG